MQSEAEQKKRERRRRTCLDETIKNFAQRQRRRGDPAGKVLLQLMMLVSAALALLSVFKDRSHAPRDRRQPPEGYTLGAAAWARERGLEPVPDEWQTITGPRLAPMSRPLPRCSWSRLVKDLRRRPTRDRARAMIEERIPCEAHSWLRTVILSEDWSTLRMLGQNADAQQIRERAVLMALAADLQPPDPTISNRDDADLTVEGMMP